MLKSENLNDKGYEELISEALSRIPLFSDEWTNFNQSDPGITILQNLTSFNMLQQSYLNEVTDAVRRRLLGLLGFTAGENRPSRVLLRCAGGEALRLPAQKKFDAGGFCFETETPLIHEPWNIAAVYAVVSEGGAEAFTDVTYLLRTGTAAGAAPFGAKPAPGCALCCILDGKPGAGASVLLWAQVSGAERRAGRHPDYPVRFAKVKWQIYTAHGWADAQAEDETDALLFSGRIRLTLPKEEPAEFNGAPRSGYALRCILTEAEYDLAPRLRVLEANLIPLVQCDTCAADYVFSGRETVELFSEMISYDVWSVYCREEENGSFRLYRPWTGGAETGRFYLPSEGEDGILRLGFDRERFGFAPVCCEEAVHIVCYEEEAVLHRDLGVVLGYEGQTMQIELPGHLLPQKFRLMAESQEDGEKPAYTFVSPGNGKPGGFRCTLLTDSGQLRIDSPEGLEGCRLYLCACAVTEGSAGNVREQNRFVPRAGDASAGTALTNPGAGRGGALSESPEQLRLRFAAEMNHPTAAVLASDYEKIVRETPGLCIRKVRAVAEEGQNRVKIAVQSYSEEKFPRLSPFYTKQIQHWLEPRRLIATRAELVQPRYIPVGVRATLYVKSYYEDAKREIEELLNRELDFTASDRGFGETLRYRDIFRRLSGLPCVDSVYELILVPQTRGFTRSGSDIRLDDDCLCYPGTLSLELCSHAGIPQSSR